MKVIESTEEMKKASQAYRDKGKKIAFVPTMGYLHQGHLSLMSKGKALGDVLVVSIFVNPTQFGKGEDFERYPRDIEQDRKLCENEGVDIIFAPTVKGMYPEGYQTYVDVENVTRNLCGVSRPGHFRGVSTVVTKLFNVVRPDCAIFGEKDFQQLAVIKRLVRDLNMDVEIIGMSIVREPDGLAMSSRNSYLNQEERGAATQIYKALQSAKELFDEGERSSNVLLTEVRRVVEISPLIAPDYVKIVDINTLEDMERVDDEALLALAVRIGKTRLIDNIILRKA